jgi:two-component SAPR family response regulator
MSAQSTQLHTQSRIDIGHHLTTHPSAVLMRVLGPVQVFSANQEVTFRKGKALELLCWLAFHRECPTVSGARTALWEIDVKDATFHNVLSELRHGLSSVGLPEGARRVTKQRLFLDERVSTDADVLREMLLNAESSADVGPIHYLRETLSMVQGLPFGSMGYAWADAEGITSTLVWRVTRAVELVARYAAAEGDRTALLEAVSAGLRMSPGDDDFLALQELMPADRSGVQLVR